MQVVVATRTPTPTLTPTPPPGDNFDRPDSTNLGPLWVERNGNWQIASQTLRNASVGGDLVASYTGGPYFNVAVSAQMQITSEEGTVSVAAQEKRKRAIINLPQARDLREVSSRSQNPR